MRVRNKKVEGHQKEPTSMGMVVFCQRRKPSRVLENDITTSQSGVVYAGAVSQRNKIHGNETGVSVGPKASIHEAMDLPSQQMACMDENGLAFSRTTKIESTWSGIDQMWKSNEAIDLSGPRWYLYSRKWSGIIDNNKIYEQPWDAFLQPHHQKQPSTTTKSDCDYDMVGLQLNLGTITARRELPTSY